MNWRGTSRLVGVTLGLAVACRPRPASLPPGPVSGAGDIAGIWYGVRQTPTAHDGLVELRRTGGTWSGSYRGKAAEVTVEGKAVSLSAEGAELRGTLGSESIRGFWIQPPMNRSNQPRATPIAMSEVEPGRYRGAVSGLRDRLRYYLVVSRDAATSRYHAFVRNPELNQGRRLIVSRVDRRKNVLTFVGRRGRGVAFTAELENGRMTADFSGRRVELRRLSRNSADLAGFWLRPPGSGPYRYLPPEETDDGWEVAHADSVNVAPDALERLVEHLSASACPERVRALCPHSVLVAVGGRLILEEYFAGHDRETLHDTRSAGKSLATTMIGFAVDRGFLKPRDRVADILAAYAPFKHDGAHKRAMAVADLMTMSSGLACDDNDEESPGREDNLNPDVAGHDLARYIVDLPVVAAPGARAVYCSANMVLLAPVLERAAGRSSAELVQAWFAEPLDVPTYHLNLTPRGRAYFGGGIYLRPRDMAKLGHVFAGDGTWRGRRIISRRWMKEALRPRARINDPVRNDYGYGWWTKTYRVGDRTVEAFYASGNGGQLIFGFPARGGRGDVHRGQLRRLPNVAGVDRRGRSEVRAAGFARRGRIRPVKSLGLVRAIRTRQIRLKAARAAPSDRTGLGSVGV